MCVLTNKRYVKISNGIFIRMPGSCPRGWTLGAGVPKERGVKKFKHGHVAYQIDGDDEHNRMKVNKNTLGLNW